MTEFTKYTESILSALQTTARSQDTISKKQGILDSIYQFHNLVPESVLFVGFNPAILSNTTVSMSVTEISPATRAYLDSKHVAYTYIDSNELGDYQKSFDVVIAADEYFTFAASADQQTDLVDKICSLARSFVISTLRDYKNQDFKDREFSIPAVVRAGPTNKVYTEFHNWSMTDRAAWVSKLYEIDNTTDELTVYGPYNRRTMYFKQLAKFGMDAGAGSFTVHKNLMYKSPVKKNYEHVISIRFED